MFRQMRATIAGRLALPFLVLSVASFGAWPAHAKNTTINVSKAGVTPHCGGGNAAGCNWCYKGSGGCFMVIGCKGNKCQVTTVGQAPRSPTAGVKPVNLGGVKHEPSTGAAIYSRTNESGQQSAGGHSAGMRK
jgi:hypothetical protein